MKSLFGLVFISMLSGSVMAQTVVELYDSAMVRYGAKQFLQGIELCNQALTIEPNNKDVLNRRAFGYISLKQFDKAIPDCNKAISIDSLLAKAYYNRATAYYHTEAYQKSVQDYEKALSIEPKLNSFIAYSFLGYAHFKLGNHSEAEKYYQKALGLNPKDPISWFYVGYSQAIQNRFAEAIPNYNEAIRLNAADPIYFYRRGQAFFNSKRYKEAIADFQQCISMDNRYQDANTYYYLGYALFHDQQHSKSMEAINKSIALKPDFALNYYINGQNKSNLGQYQEALLDYEKAIQYKINEPFVHIKKGYSLNELQRYDEAILAFNTYIQMNPKEATGFSFRCFSNLQINQYDKAIADCNEALRLRPNDVGDLSNIGYAYDKKGDHLKTVLAYDACENTGVKTAEFCGGDNKAAAIMKLPDLPEADATLIYQQGLWLIKFQKASEAVLLFDKGMNRFSQDASMYFGKYLAMKAMLKFVGRETIIETAVRLNPNQAEYQYWLGFEYFLSKRDQEAKSAFDKSMALGGQYLVQQNKDMFGANYKQIILNRENQAYKAQETQQTNVNTYVISETMNYAKNEILNGLYTNKYKIIVEGNSNTGNVQNTYRQPWADLRYGQGATFTVIVPESANVRMSLGNGNSCLTGQERNGSGVMILSCQTTNYQQFDQRFNFNLEIIGTNIPFYYVVAVTSVE